METPHHSLLSFSDAARLREEIGHDGDCAYEKAMIRFFEQELAARRAHLLAA